MAYKIILDPGHGGSDPGATFNGRQEKDEALGLAMSVGKLLKTQALMLHIQELQMFIIHLLKKQQLPTIWGRFICFIP